MANLCNINANFTAKMRKTYVYKRIFIYYQALIQSKIM